MKAKDIIIVMLLVGLAVASYFLGFQRGARLETLKGDLRVRILVHLALYHSVERGDLPKVQGTLGMLLLGEVRSYQQQFGEGARHEHLCKAFCRREAHC